MMKGALGVVMLSTLTFSGAVWAQESETADETGFYGAFDLGQSSAASACNGLPAGVSCQDSGMAYRVGAGYQLDRNLGFEASYASYGAIKFSGFGAAATLDSTSLQLAAVGTLPLNNELALIGKVGLASTTTKSSGVSTLGVTPGQSASKISVVFGAGVRYKISRAVALRAQYEDLGTIGEAATTGQFKASMLSAGVTAGF